MKVTLPKHIKLDEREHVAARGGYRVTPLFESVEPH